MWFRHNRIFTPTWGGGHVQKAASGAGVWGWGPRLGLSRACGLGLGRCTCRHMVIFFFFFRPKGARSRGAERKRSGPCKGPNEVRFKRMHRRCILMARFVFSFSWRTLRFAPRLVNRTFGAGAPEGCTFNARVRVHVCAACMCALRACVRCVHVCAACMCALRACVRCVHVCAACMCALRACVRCVCALRACVRCVHVCEAPNRNFDTIRCTRRSNRAVAFSFQPFGLGLRPASKISF